ncbi:MAG: putative membrane protein YfcA [Lysobacterales bacterium]|jgi:uncharacterized membrane protein YfcA
MIWVDYAMIGLLAGFFAGYLGIGGGLIIVPALAWLFSRDSSTAQYAIHMAVATSLSTMVITSLSSIYAHHRRGAILWPLTRTLSPGLLLGAVLGAFLAVQLSTDVLTGFFGAYAALAGIQLIAGRVVTGEKPLPGLPILNLTGLTIGSVSSLVGIGGGSMTVPWLLWHGRKVKSAVATASTFGFPIAVASTISFVLLGLGQDGFNSSTGFVHLPAFAGIVVFSVLSAPLGAAAVHSSPPVLVRRIFGVFMLLVAWKMLF